jgi:hypothetical protein
MNFPAAIGTLLPAAALTAAAFLLAGAMSTPTAPSTHPAALEATQSEIVACERAGARTHAECVAEAEGKALIRRAEWVAGLEDGHGRADAGAGATEPGVIVIHPSPRVWR